MKTFLLLPQETEESKQRAKEEYQIYIRFATDPKSNQVTVEQANVDKAGQAGCWYIPPWSEEGWILLDVESDQIGHYRISQDGTRILRRTEKNDSPDDSKPKITQIYEKWSKGKYFIASNPQEFGVDGDSKLDSLSPEKFQLPKQLQKQPIFRKIIEIGQETREKTADIKPAGSKLAAAKTKPTFNWEVNKRHWLRLEWGDDGQLYQYTAESDSFDFNQAGSWSDRILVQPDELENEFLVWDGGCLQILAWQKKEVSKEESSQFELKRILKGEKEEIQIEALDPIGISWEKLSSDKSESLSKPDSKAKKEKEKITKEILTQDSSALPKFSCEKVAFWPDSFMVEADLDEAKADDPLSNWVQWVKALRHSTNSLSQYQVVIKQLLKIELASKDDKAKKIADDFFDGFLSEECEDLHCLFDSKQEIKIQDCQNKIYELLKKEANILKLPLPKNAQLPDSKNTQCVGTLFEKRVEWLDQIIQLADDVSLDEFIKSTKITGKDLHILEKMYPFTALF